MTFYVKSFGENFFSVSAMVFGFEMAVRYENKRSGADPVNVLVIMMSLKGENYFR